MNAPSDGPGPHAPPRSRRAFWGSAVLGWAVIAYGLRGIAQHHVDTRPANLAGFVLGGALLHDLVIAPAMIVVGVGLARLTRRRDRSLVQAGLIVSACVALFSYPLVRNYARALHNPSSLPHNYVANLAVVLAFVWVGVGLVALARRIPRRKD